MLNPDPANIALINMFSEENELKKVVKNTEKRIKQENEMIQILSDKKFDGLRDLEKRKNKCLARIVDAQEFYILYLELEIEKLKNDLKVWNEQTGSVSGI